MGHRTGVQIECPHIIQIPLVGFTAEDEELGTDHRHGRAVTTDGLGTIEYDAGPHSRYWRARKSNQLESVLKPEDSTCRG
jgi:hypothetical protein